MELNFIIPLLARVDEVFPISLYSCDENLIDKITVNGSLLYDSSLHDDCSKIIEKCLCFSFNSDGQKTLTIDVLFKDTTIKTVIKNIEIITELNDIVFTSDDQLQIIDSNIHSHLPCGRLSYLYKIRQATKDILAMMAEYRIKNNGIDCSCLCESEINKFVEASEIYSIDDVRQWANYYTLYLIHNELNDSVEDIHKQKADYYYQMASTARDRALIRFKNTTGFYIPKTKARVKLVRSL